MSNFAAAVKARQEAPLDFVGQSHSGDIFLGLQIIYSNSSRYLNLQRFSVSEVLVDYTNATTML